MRTRSLVALFVAVVVGGVAVLLALSGSSRSAGSAPTASDRGGGPGVRRLAEREWLPAVERTVAAGSARLDATYTPPSGPAVTITGRTSFVGPEAEVSAVVGDDPPVHVRVTAEGAWLRMPGGGGWSPVPLEELSTAAGARGWADLLGTLRSSDDVWADGEGRIVRVRRAGFDVRFSDFGTTVINDPP